MLVPESIPSHQGLSFELVGPWYVQCQTVGHRPAHQGRYSTNSGGVRSGGSSPFQSPGMAPKPLHSPTLGSSSTTAQPHFGFQQHMGRSHGQRAGHQAMLSETDLVDLSLAQDFPQAQQPFLMFLQAADSHRLNTCLVRQATVPIEVCSLCT